MNIIGFIIFCFAYFLWGIVFFCLIQKPMFGAYNSKVNNEHIHPADVWHVYSHGFVSDCIIASYLTALPLLIAALYTMLPVFSFTASVTAYNIVISLAVGLITLSDTVLYRFWGYKLDASVFVYLRSLKGALASVSTIYVVCGVAAALTVSAIFFVGAECVSIYVGGSLMQGIWLAWWQYPLVILLTVLLLGILFAIIRGLKIRPNNPSVVYFSKNPFFNHWALNPAYNLIYSLSTKDDFKGQFRFFAQEECDEIISSLFPTSGTPQKQLLRTDRPNILVVVWESMGAEFVPSLGGRPDVGVNVDRLAKDGVLFTHCTAGSFRTDRGLVCILSGVPGQPTTSVIRYTRKLPNLPALPRRLKAEGYETTAVHGGELTIMHKSDYYLASGHDTLISQKDLPKSAPSCKWGVQDGYMFDMLYDDIVEKTKSGKRWFTTFQTLSSHEPFTVPYNRIPEDKVANAFAYTDECFGTFVDKLRQSPAWDNLLIVCVADHGFNSTDRPVSRSKYAHIPLLLTGGALAATGRIDTIMSQTDIAATLLGQMGLNHDDFPFSRDVLADSYTHPFSFHTYNNGFMFTDTGGHTIVDNVSGEAIENPDEERIRKGRAILQKLYEDLSRR